MDVWMVSALLSLWLLHVDSGPGTVATTPTRQDPPDPTTIGPEASIRPPPPTAPRPAPAPAAAPAPALGLLSVRWGAGLQCCEGVVWLFQSSTSQPVCWQSEGPLRGAPRGGLLRGLLSGLCQGAGGCGGAPSFLKGNWTSRGSKVNEEGQLDNVGCDTVKITCQGSELTSYKVLTAVLIVLMLLALLVRFTPTAIKTLQSQMSDRRRNRWIGPTQSQSVSYHRRKTVIQNDAEKKTSYPALERLTVASSREPSSNRNSDCDY